MAKPMHEKNTAEILFDMGIIKRKLSKEERKEILYTVKSIYPKGGGKALDLALILSVITLIGGKRASSQS